MTDEIEEIRARHEAAAAEGRFNTVGYISSDHYNQANADRAVLLARVAELEGALKPFAEEGRKWANCIDADDQYILIAHPIDVIVDSDGEIDGISDAAFRLGDLRRSAAVLKETP